MTADTSLTDAFLQVFGAPTFELPRDDATYEDGETLARSRHGLSRSARRMERRPRFVRPTEPWCDEISRASGEWDGDPS